MNKKSTISEYEHDRRSISLLILTVMAKELGTTLDYLVGGTQAEEQYPDIIMAIRMLKGLKTEKGKKAALEHIRVVAGME